MPYLLKPERPIESEIRRIVDKQLKLALERLRDSGDLPRDTAIHEARRHVKKVRAAVRLVHPAIGDAYDATNARMRTVNRMLGPIADGEAIVDFVGRLQKKHRAQLSPQALGAIRAGIGKRATRIDRNADLQRTVVKVSAILQAERRRLALLTLRRHGFRALQAGLIRSVRRARGAMFRVTAEPTSDNYHFWRRRVKDLWLQVRLLNRRCGDKLAADERRLKALEECLGEHHTIVLFEQALMTEAVVSRQETARCLRLLRRDQRALRRRATALGRRIFDERPRHFVRRIRRVWNAANTGGGISREASAPWRRVA